MENVQDSPSTSPVTASEGKDESQSAKKDEKGENTVPVRTYLDNTVVPILLQAMSSLVNERPEDPIAYVAEYLLKNNPMTQQKSQSTGE
jgi:protein dpy-30